jgi:hypothetical protein
MNSVAKVHETTEATIRRLEEIVRDGLPRRVARATVPTKNAPANTSRLEAYLCVCITPNCLVSVFHGDRCNECFLRNAS